MRMRGDKRVIGGKQALSRFILLLCLVMLIFAAPGASALTNLALSGTAIADSCYGGCDGEYGAAKGNDGDFNTRWSTEGTDGWYGIDWGTPKTFNCVFVRFFPDWHLETFATVEVWDGTQWVLVAQAGDGVNPLPLALAISFPTQTASQVRINHMVTFNEFEVYDASMISGVVRDQNWQPVIGANVRTGEASTYTDSNGSYLLILDPGTYTVTVEKYYIYAQQDITVAQGESATLDFTVQDYNLARSSLALALASSSYPGYDPVYSNDGNPQTRWSKDEGDEEGWYEVNWMGGVGSPQTFNTIVLRQYPDPAYQVSSLKIEVWDDATSGYKEVTTIGDGVNLLPETIVAQFPVQTSMILRVSKLHTFMELEVYNSPTVSGTVTSAITGSPIYGAYIYGGLAAVTSDANGAYSIPMPAPGSGTIHASRFPFDDLSVDVTVPAGGMTRNLVMTGGGPNLALDAAATEASSTAEGHTLAMINDNDADTSWASNDERASWVVIEWSTPKTVDTVQILNGSIIDLQVYIWRSGGWFKVAQANEDGFYRPSVNVTFTPRETMKMKIIGAWMAPELEVYNLHGAAPVDTLQGVVTNALTGEGLAGATVTAGGLSTTTASNGSYALMLDPGAVTVSVERQGYVAQDRIVDVPATGFAQADFALTTTNIAPYATASASSYWPGFPPALGNDDDPTTRFSFDSGDWEVAYDLEWPAPVTLNSLKVYSMGELWWSILEDWEVYTWDGTDWVLQTTLPRAMVWEPTFAPVTTAKLRVRGPATFSEVEVHASTAAIPVGAVRALPNGMIVQVTGSTTAVFPDAAYVESLDRSAGIRVQPAAGFVPDLETTVTGGLTTVELERAIIATQVVTRVPNPVGPLAVTNRSLSTSSDGLSTIGQLMTTTGRIIHVEPAEGGASYLYIDDGSAVPSDLTGIYGLRVGPVVSSFGPTDYVRATGIAGAVMSGGVPIRTLRPRSSLDVIKY